LLPADQGFVPFEESAIERFLLLFDFSLVFFYLWDRQLLSIINLVVLSLPKGNGGQLFSQALDWLAL